MSWHDAAHAYALYLKTSGRSDQTVRTYVASVGLFWRWCHDREMDTREVERQAVRMWFGERQAAVSSTRCNHDLAALRQFFAMLREDRVRNDDPTDGISIKRRKSLPTDPLATDDILSLLEVCRHERDRLIILMLAHTGMRISELADLHAEDIDWQHGTIKVRGKGDKERRLAPHPEILGRLRAFVGMFPAGPIWRSQKQKKQLSAHQMRKILYDLAAHAKVDDVHPHRFRSFFATEYIEQFGDIQALQGVLGHESIETSARYSQFTRERRGLEQMRSLRFDQKAG